MAENREITLFSEPEELIAWAEVYDKQINPSIEDAASAPEFQQNAFSESGYFRKSRWAGNYEVFVAGKGYVTRYGDG